MGMLGNKKEKEGEVKDVLESLTTTIEAINQELSQTGRGSQPGASSQKRLQEIHTGLQYVYDMLKKLYQKQSEVKTGLVQFKTEVNQTMSQNIQELITEIRKIAQTLEITSGEESTTVVAGGESPKSTLDMKKKLEQLVLLFTEEAEIFKKQNKFLQEQLEKIELKLDQVIEKVSD